MVRERQYNLHNVAKINFQQTNVQSLYHIKKKTAAGMNAANRHQTVINVSETTRL